ncbi:MAG: hypothetical protein OEW86_07740 [Nitrosopumilus sp.]|nr:hypothetical protein [Nitrosopumilus sp.]
MHHLQEFNMKKSGDGVTKVYCEKCDLVFKSREKFEKHLVSHSSNIVYDVCPVDTAIAKFLDLFKRKSSRNLE